MWTRVVRKTGDRLGAVMRENGKQPRHGSFQVPRRLYALVVFSAAGSILDIYIGVVGRTCHWGFWGFHPKGTGHRGKML